MVPDMTYFGEEKINFLGEDFSSFGTFPPRAARNFKYCFF
jgi:hypothetical protein